MSNLINPQDPVVTMLKELVSQYDKKMDDMAEEINEALQLIMGQNSAATQLILKRLVAAEEAILRLQGQEPAGKSDITDTTDRPGAEL